MEITQEIEQEGSTTADQDGQPKGYLRVLVQQGLEQTDHPIYEGMVIHHHGYCILHYRGPSILLSPHLEIRSTLSYLVLGFMSVLL